MFAAILVPSLLQYTENSRAQKDESAMDEVVNAVQLAMADEQCYDEVLKYSCTNNYITYTDSSGIYGQVIADGEFWAPDGSGRATTITFNPEYGSNNQIIYDLSKGIVNDMTYGNGSVAVDRVMEGNQIENNQCYFKNLTRVYNSVRQSVGSDIITTSQTYRNSSFTIFIKFSQKDSTTVADVDGSFNGTNLYEGAVASKGSGTSEYDDNGDAIVSITTPGTTESNYTSTDLSGTGSFTPDYKQPHNSSNTYDPKAPELNPKEDIVLKSGDTYIYGDYEYKFFDYSGRDGTKFWSVTAIDKTKTEYGPILETLHGYPIERLDRTFYNCKNMIQAPIIPSGVNWMYYTFENCESLIKAPDMSNVIFVESMQYTFDSCSNLQRVESLPQKVLKMESTFFGCFKLQYVTALPNGVQSLDSTFEACITMVNFPEIPNSVTDMSGTFCGCKAMTQSPKIPDGVITMYATYSSCENLVMPPDLSKANSLQSLSATFIGCKSLKVAPTIPSSVTNMDSTFSKCSSLKTPPTIPDNVTTMASTFSECTSLEFAPLIPNKVKSLSTCFYKCTTLSGTIKINANPNNIYLCFKDVDFKAQSITLSGASTKLDALGASGKNYCATCNGKCNGSH